MRSNKTAVEKIAKIFSTANEGQPKAERERRLKALEAIAKKAGRPKTMVRCTYCKTKMGTREREKHEPHCPKRP